METERPTRDLMFMAMAHAAASRSTCSRLKVGCVITNQDGTSVVGIGYNGNARGLSNECDSTEPGNCGCIHAEENALLKAPYNPGNFLTLYTTFSPCVRCAKLILNSQVSRVAYNERYRLEEGVKLLRRNGVMCQMLSQKVTIAVSFDASMTEEELYGKEKPVAVAIAPAMEPTK